MIFQSSCSQNGWLLMECLIALLLFSIILSHLLFWQLRLYHEVQGNLAVTQTFFTAVVLEEQHTQ